MPDDLPNSLCCLIQSLNLQVEDNSPECDKYLKILSESLSSLVWKTSQIWSICEKCLESIIKSLVTLISAVVGHLQEAYLSEELPSTLLKVAYSRKGFSKCQLHPISLQFFLQISIATNQKP